MRTAAAGGTAGTGQRLPRGVPAPGTTPCTRMGRDECRHVKQRRLELPQANGRVACSHSDTNSRSAADAAACT